MVPFTASLAGTAVSQKGQMHKSQTKLRTGWSNTEKGRKVYLKQQGNSGVSPTCCCLDLWEWPTNESQEILDRPRTNLKFHQKQEEGKRGSSSVHSGVKQIQTDCSVRKVWWETKGQRATSVYTKAEFKGVCDFITQHKAFPNERLSGPFLLC